MVRLTPPTRRLATDEQTISETDSGEEKNKSRSQDAIICEQTPKPDPTIAATVDDDKIIVPSKAVQGEIRYLINSLSKTNLETKVRIHTNTLIMHS
jgi:hypothetical protein